MNKVVCDRVSRVDNDAGRCAGKTHRELFDDWVTSMVGESASELIATGRDPMHARDMFENMMRDIPNGGGLPGCPLTHATYALGYNLAIEYLADYEKRWMLESFRKLDGRFMQKQGCNVDWLFLEVRPSSSFVFAPFTVDFLTTEKEALKSTIKYRTRDIHTRPNGTTAPSRNSFPALFAMPLTTVSGARQTPL